MSRAFRSVCDLVQVGKFAFLACTLTGCATTERLVTVNVPVPIECREKEPARPAMDTETLDPASTIDVQSRAMRAEIEIREGYEDRLRTALRNCIALISGQEPPWPRSEK